MDEITRVVSNCYHVVSDIPEQTTRSYSVSSAVRTESGSAGGSSKMSRVELVKRDWLRFIIFVKMCLIQLL